MYVGVSEHANLSGQLRISFWRKALNDSLGAFFSRFVRGKQTWVMQRNKEAVAF